ncbi:MAG: type II toxin-antitoxin system VapC family toxin [Puniceicoccales bacterium]
MIIVDVNILLYATLPGDNSEACARLAQADPDWFAPKLWQHEFANVLATYERQAGLSREDSLAAYQDALDLVHTHENDIPIERVLMVAKKFGCSGYDAQYVALAEDLGIPMYTYDKKLLAATPSITRKPE